MNTSYKFINNVSGWFVFLIAAITYLLTIEPTASFWDCGEFITTSYNLEVGHPPGDPIFMVLGRFFSLFSFGDPTLVAKMINIMSGLASAFTILFLFWSITHIAKRVISKDENEPSLGSLITIIGSGAVGALAYTFSDTFWFSAVEGEVYATSSLFTAIVFWAILKWESESDQKYSTRWIILIAYLMGLSIGVHLLNLLAIPAIVFVYYFKKHEISVKGVAIAGLISVVLLWFIMYGVIQGSVQFASWFERTSVNSLGLPFNVGFMIFIIIIMLGLIAGVYFTYKYKKTILNTLFTSILMIFIGYSAYAIIVIRSQADPPMNQNKPDNVFGLISYLQREQYGDRPLFYGKTFNAEIKWRDDGRASIKEGRSIYFKDEEKGAYKETVTQEYEYNNEYMMLFPRMYSDQESPDHVRGYLQWIGKSMDDFFEPYRDQNGKPVIDKRTGEVEYNKLNPVRPPTFGENLTFFFRYQLNFMYIRYFMWNFVGRQNDIQGDGNVKYGNWISGIKFIDEVRLGDQDNLTSEMKENKARNTYFFLPLLLGIAGMIYLFTANKTGNNYFWVIMLLFFFTGVAIVLYLNQPPFQPRERDYAYAGSFYAFAMYIGFGVAGIVELIKKYIPLKQAAIAATVLSLGVPVLMAQQNWDDHDRSGRYTARDYAKNYLNSCAENAVIFTNGDNDTFPLWYVQEVERYRTDIRVVNLSYFNTDWYINQMRKKAYKSPPINFTLRPDQYEMGVRDGISLEEDQGSFFSEKYRANKHKYQNVYESLFNDFISIIDKSNFADKFSKDYNDIKTNGADKIDPANFYAILQTLLDEKTYNDNKLDFDKKKLEAVKVQAEGLLTNIQKEAYPINEFIKYIAKDDLRGFKMPATNLSIPVNKDELIKNNVVAKNDTSRINENLTWDFKRRHIGKNDMMVIDMLATNNWERPIYFATTVGPSNYLKLEPFFQLEGLAYRVLPIKRNSKYDADMEGRLNSDILYKNMMEKFVWGGIDENPEDLYLDENNRRFIMNYKSAFRDLAAQLVKENKKDSAEKVIDKCVKLFPNSVGKRGYYDIQLAEQYYALGKQAKGDSLMSEIADVFTGEFNYLFSLEDKHMNWLYDELRRYVYFSSVWIDLMKDKNNEIAQKYMKNLIEKIDKRYNFGANIESGGNAWFDTLEEYKKLILVNLYMPMTQEIK